MNTKSPCPGSGSRLVLYLQKSIPEGQTEPFLQISLTYCIQWPLYSWLPYCPGIPIGFKFLFFCLFYPLFSRAVFANISLGCEVHDRQGCPCVPGCFPLAVTLGEGAPRTPVPCASSPVCHGDKQVRPVSPRCALTLLVRMIVCMKIFWPFNCW